MNSTLWSHCFWTKSVSMALYYASQWHCVIRLYLSTHLVTTQGQKDPHLSFPTLLPRHPRSRYYGQHCKSCTPIQSQSQDSVNQGTTASPPLPKSHSQALTLTFTMCRYESLLASCGHFVYKDHRAVACNSYVMHNHCPQHPCVLTNGCKCPDWCTARHQGIPGYVDPFCPRRSEFVVRHCVEVCDGCVRAAAFATMVQELVRVG